jgi:hypothetical protein
VNRASADEEVSTRRPFERVDLFELTVDTTKATLMHMKEAAGKSE